MADVHDEQLIRLPWKKAAMEGREGVGVRLDGWMCWGVL